MCIEKGGFVRETKSLISTAFQHHLSQKNLKASKNTKISNSYPETYMRCEEKHMLENSQKILRHKSGNFRQNWLLGTCSQMLRIKNKAT